MFFKSLIFFSIFLVSVQRSTAATDKIICFFQSWAGYRVGEGTYRPQNIDASLCTHIYYAFLGVNDDGTLEILDSWNEIDLGGHKNTQTLKQKNPNLRVLISIGGFNNLGLLTNVIGSPSLRTNLINSCISFFQQYGYDGIDIDWIYPGQHKENFVSLLQEMKTAFSSRGYVLSVTAMANGAVTGSYGYDIHFFLPNRTVDLLNVMTYDYHISGGPGTGLNAPLYGYINSVDGSVQSWIEAGANASKLTLGIPFYGHTFNLTDEELHEVGSPAVVGIAGPYTQNPGSLGYNEICQFYDDWTRVWVEDAQVPYKYYGSNWLSYDDPESVALKAKYAKDQGLAGVAVWSVDTDDFHGACGEAYPLLHAIKNILD